MTKSAAEQSFDAIVIGAGFGGASCAGLLAKRGLKVLVIEKNARAGGKAMSISKNGFTCSPWVIIGAPVVGNLYQVVLDELGVSDLAKILVPGTQGSLFKTSSGEYKRLPQMPEGVAMDPNVLFDWLEVPQDVRGSTLQFMAELTLMPREQALKLHGTTFDSWLRARNVPKSVYAFLVSLCCDGMFMVPVDTLDAGEAITSLQAMFLRNGGVFCEGGWGRVAEAYCEAVRRNGGTVRMGERVKEILVEDGEVRGVVTAKGTYRAPIVISNAGIQPTMLKLIKPEHLDKAYVSRIKSLVPSWSLVGYRYFLSGPITDAPYGVLISQDSPWSLERFNKAKRGEASKEGVVYFEIPSNYDPVCTPKGKHIVLTGAFAPASPDMSKEELMSWVNAGEELMFKAFPQMESLIEEKDLYTTKDVSNLTREATVPGTGGETIGLGQIIGQCGPDKPSIQGPLRGLYIVGADAGGTGVGTQMAIESGMNVATAVKRDFEMRRANP